MKNFWYKQYLKGLLRVYLVRYNFFRCRSLLLHTFFYLRSFPLVAGALFKNVNKSYKVVFILTLIMTLFSTAFLLGRTYSQDLGSNATGVIGSNYVQSEFSQFAQMTNGIIQGSTNATSGQTDPGLLGVMSNVEAYVYTNNPISFGKYAQYYAQEHAIVPSSYAQSATTGSGYSALAPVIPLWELARNIAYLIIAVMIVVIGFIIIAGGKYGQMEVSIISSIPKILFAIIIITFSYPIAGLAVDVANLGTNLIVDILGPQFVQPSAFFIGQYPVPCGQNLISVQQNPGAGSYTAGLDSGQVQKLQACGYFSKGPAKALGGDFNIFRLMSPLVNYQNWDTQETGNNQILNLIQVPTNIGFLDALLQDIPFGLQGLTQITVQVILNILILFWAIKIFILILTSFVRIAVTAMLGPLMLVAMPLQGLDVFWGYIRSLLAPALVFPAVFGMMFIAAIFAYGTDCLQTSGSSAGQSVPCVPSTSLNQYDYGPWYIKPDNGLTNFNSGPLLFVDTVNPVFIWNFVALGIIIAIPGIGKHIDEMLKNEVSRHLAQQGADAAQRAQGLLKQVPFVGSLIGRVV